MLIRILHFCAALLRGTFKTVSTVFRPSSLCLFPSLLSKCISQCEYFPESYSQFECMWCLFSCCILRFAFCTVRSASSVFFRFATCVLRSARCVRFATCVLRFAFCVFLPFFSVLRLAFCVLCVAFVLRETCFLRSALCVLRFASCALRSRLTVCGLRRFAKFLNEQVYEKMKQVPFNLHVIPILSESMYRLHIRMISQRHVSFIVLISFQFFLHRVA